ncbi:MAG: hypothetical protein EXS59_02415 [Candidatus Taylorbacteria bacterium]|nr:hypothetical protein [Candidatus Taylorbacteria bacterium]
MDQLALDLGTFYFKFGHSVPTNPHYEIQVLSPEPVMLMECTIPVVRSDATGEYFIAYPNPVQTFTKMWEVLTHWCVMSSMILDGAFTLEELMYIDDDLDSNLLLRVTERKFGVRVCAHKFY